MSDKDYYQILQILPQASAAEIKKAYRMMALEFHPDRNKSQWAADQFTIIQEAYQVLSNPIERKKYDAARFTGQQSSRRIATTPEEIRWMSEELATRIKNSNPDNINRDRLVYDLEAVLSVYHIQLLERWKDAKWNQLITEDILFCLQHTDWNDCMRITQTLLSINGVDEKNRQAVHSFIVVYKKNFYWHKYKVIVALLIALLLCLLIYLS